MNTIFLEPEQEALLRLLVEAHERLPRSERCDFEYSPAYIRFGARPRAELEAIINRGESVIYKGQIISRVEDISWNHDQDIVFHPGLPNGSVDVVGNDIDILRFQTLIHFKTGTLFFLTPQGIAFHREARIGPPPVTPDEEAITPRSLISFEGNDQRDANLDVNVENMAGNDIYKDNVFYINVAQPPLPNELAKPFDDLTDQQRSVMIELARKMDTQLYHDEFRGVRLQQFGWKLILVPRKGGNGEEIGPLGLSILPVLSEEGYISIAFDRGQCRGVLKQKALHHYRLWKSQQED